MKIRLFQIFSFLHYLLLHCFLSGSYPCISLVTYCLSECVCYSSLTPKKEKEKKNNIMLFKTGLSWSASLVDCKPPSMENKRRGVDHQGFFPALSRVFLSVRLGPADSWSEVLMHKATVTLVIQTWFLEIWTINIWCCVNAVMPVHTRPVSVSRWRFAFDLRFLLVLYLAWQQFLPSISYLICDEFRSLWLCVLCKL